MPDFAKRFLRYRRAGHSIADSLRLAWLVATALSHPPSRVR